MKGALGEVIDIQMCNLWFPQISSCLSNDIQINLAPTPILLPCLSSDLLWPTVVNVALTFSHLRLNFCNINYKKLPCVIYM